ncbi:hypothetical protein [Serratia fonticola]|nr:hypothetical protein [Serratia fonticola]
MTPLPKTQTISIPIQQEEQQQLLLARALKRYKITLLLWGLNL